MCAEEEACHLRSGREATFIETEAFIDRQRKSSGGTRYGGVAESEEDVESALQQRSSKRTPEDVRVVCRTNGERGERRTKRWTVGWKWKRERVTKVMCQKCCLGGTSFGER